MPDDPIVPSPVSESLDPLELFPVQRGAALISVSTSELYRMLRRGDLPAVRFGKGRGLRVRRVDLQRFIDERTGQYSPRRYARDFGARPINPKQRKAG